VSEQCNTCGQIKPLSDYYVDQKAADGRICRCKECHKAGMKAARAARSGYYLQYDRDRANNPNRVAARKAYSQSEHGKERIAAGSKAWIGRNPQKRAANIKADNAIARGRLIKQPCEVCGALEVHAHHDDYSRPMDVRWFCVQHHADHHVVERRERSYAELGGEIVIQNGVAVFKLSN
jgi:hypothetical protein